LAGTPFLPKFKEAILVLEEIDERPYRIDRMLSQLRLAGVLKDLRGLVLGQFTQCENTDATRPSLSCEEVLQEFSTALAVPTLTGLLHGHVTRKVTLPWGVKARLRTASCQLEVLESALVD
jgi:muramoyltetrapeptide carboxypeptidase